MRSKRKKKEIKRRLFFLQRYETKKKSVFACRAISPGDVYCTSQGKHLPLLFCLVVCVKLIRKARKHRQTSFISTARKQLKVRPKSQDSESYKGRSKGSFMFVQEIKFHLWSLLYFKSVRWGEIFSFFKCGVES